MFKYLAILSLIFQVTLASAAIVGFNADITNRTGNTANDFHVGVGVSGGGSIILQDDRFYTGSQDPFTVRNATNGPGSLANDIDLHWSVPSSPIQPGNTIHIGWEFDDGGLGNSTRYREGQTYWTTLNGTKLPGTQPILPGFTAAGIGSNSLFTLHNDTNQQLTIQNLAFQILTTRTDLNDMIPFALPGFTLPLSDFAIDAGMSLMFNPGSMQPGDFLLAELTAFPTSEPTNISAVMFQHGVSVPEPPTLLLVVFGIIGLFRIHGAKLGS